MEKKKQHIIPHCYQKAWVDSETPENKEPYIWLFDKKGNLFKNKSPKKTFTETDFYTIPNKITGRDLSLEDGLSTLEYQYEKVYREVVSLNYEITEDNKLILCAFIAAMHSRTWAYKQFIGNQFQEMLEMGKRAEKHLINFDKNPKKYAVTLPPPKGSKTISMSDIQELAERPLQSLMFPKIAADIGFLITMNLAILTNETEDCFVSSDDPCTLFDPQKENNFWGPPPLARETIEVTLPISPRQVIMMTRTELNGYVRIDPKVVSMLNRRTISSADKLIIYNSQVIKKEWFQ